MLNEKNGASLYKLPVEVLTRHSEGFREIVSTTEYGDTDNNPLVLTSMTEERFEHFLAYLLCDEL